MSNKIDLENAFKVSNSSLKREAQCRLKNYFASDNHKNLIKKTYTNQYNLWFGSVLHLAMEELEGRDAFDGDIRKTIESIYFSFENPKGAMEDGSMNLNKLKKKELDPLDYLPEDAGEEDMELIIGMIENYYDFLEDRKLKYETVTLPNGELATEVTFNILLPVETPDGRPVVYQGQIDRICKDDYGNIYLEDYKTRSRFTNQTLDLDPQIARYLAFSDYNFDIGEIRGLRYVQMMKKLPKEPRVLKSGKLSTAKNQRTTYSKMKKALEERYGSLEKAPDKYDTVLNKLKSQEHEKSNKFFNIQVMEVPQSAKEQIIDDTIKQVEKLVAEDYEIFPTSGKHCKYCPYQDLCRIRMVQGDLDGTIDMEYKQKRDRYDEDDKLQWEKNYEMKCKAAIRVRKDV